MPVNLSSFFCLTHGVQCRRLAGLAVFRIELTANRAPYPAGKSGPLVVRRTTEQPRPGCSVAVLVVPEPAIIRRADLSPTAFGEPFLSYSFDNYTGAMYYCQFDKGSRSP
jgi:hypothetical protein